LEGKKRGRAISLPRNFILERGRFERYWARGTIVRGEGGLWGSNHGKTSAN